MLRHSERIRRVEGIRVVKTGDYFTFEVDITTEGNVRKTWHLPHVAAESLRSFLTNEMDFMPSDVRAASFKASAKQR